MHHPRHRLIAKQNVTLPSPPEGADVGPCLPGAGKKFCTVQLVPGGVRYIVAVGKIRALKDVDEDYRGFSLAYCCDGRESRLALP